MKPLECDEGKKTAEAAFRLSKNNNQPITVRCRLCEVKFRGVMKEGQIIGSKKIGDGKCNGPLIQAIENVLGNE